MAGKVEKPGSVYVLWAERTQRFKIGFTHGRVGIRAQAIAAACPYPLRVIGSRRGSVGDERDLHLALRAYRTHGEWFDLPEQAVWRLCQWLGLEIPVTVEA